MFQKLPAVESKDRSNVLALLSHGIPITLLMDLVDPAGPRSEEILESERGTEGPTTAGQPQLRIVDCRGEGRVDGSGPEVPGNRTIELPRTCRASGQVAG